MNPQQELELLQQVAQLRRENRRLQRWVMFTGIGVGILLFAPGLAALIAACSARMFELATSNAFMTPALAIVVVAAVAAVIVGSRHAAAPKSREQPSGDA